MLDHLSKQYQLHHLRPARNRTIGRPGRARDVERTTPRKAEGLLDHLRHRRARICSAAAWAARPVLRSPSRIPRWCAAWCSTGRSAAPSTASAATSASPSISPSCSRTASTRSSRWSQKDGKPFGADPRGGPWASVIKHDPAFAEAFARAGCRSLQARRRRPRPHAVRSRHGARRGARRPDAPRHSGADRPGPRRLARDVGGALPRGVPAAGRILGRRRRAQTEATVPARLLSLPGRR